MDEDQDGGLLNIQVSGDEEDAATSSKKREDRTGQTEAHFQAVKQGYSAKVENGHINKSVNVSVAPGANKLYTQELLHAVEELYFFRRYHDAAEFARKVLEANGESSGLDEETRQVLCAYESRCQHKLRNS